ncbi:hypothetical protein FJB45_002241 [Enterococcus faecium]|uniref:CDP-glycerol glycerophosphotransferase family protein n=1 Tax=Enterococcus faecium TaxID=1352 RepID=UPI0019EDFD45|nr:CDP-glycerol glycerophosphotransferase family protein [Enterococcus faecium]EGP4798100.1 hypothetical protein [Enterococcus faecium]EJX8086211.1 CDP-glycerol glycerophosphotransferase family protein [Enterococcus faecalis]EME5422581.1 CDP-glycerol glycerophosphotransferase family protein [Enterococcus faecium]
MHVKQVSFKNGNLSLKLEEENSGLICIVNRSTGKTIYETRVGKDKNGAVLNSIAENILSEIPEQLDNTIYYFDLYAVDGKNMSRLSMIPNKKIEVRERFSMDFVQNMGRAVMPYITNDGYIAIMIGSVPEIAKKGKLSIQDENEYWIEKISFYDDKLVIQSSLFAQKDSFAKYAYFESTKNKSIISGEIIGNQMIVNFTDSDCLLGGEYKLKVIKYNNTFFAYCTLLFENRYNGTEGAFLIESIFGQQLSAFSNELGEVSLHIENLLLAKATFKEERPQETKVLIDGVELKDDEIVFSVHVASAGLIDNLELWLFTKNSAVPVELIRNNLQLSFRLNDNLIRFINQNNNITFMYRYVDGSQIQIEKLLPISLINQETYISLSDDYELIVTMTQIVIKKKDFSEHHKKQELFNVSVRIRDLFCDNKKLEFEICENDTWSTMSLYAKERKKDVKISIPYTIKDKRVRIDISDILDNLDFEQARFDLYALIEYGQYNEVAMCGKITLVDSELKPKNERYLNDLSCPVDKVSFSNRNNHFMIFLSTSNSLSLVVRDKKFIYNEKYSFNSSLESCVLEDATLTIVARFNISSNVNYTFDCITLYLRSKTEDKTISVPITSVNQTEDGDVVTGAIDISNVEFDQFYYDVFVTTTIDETTTYSRIQCKQDKIKNQLNNREDNNLYYTKEGVIYPFITDRNVLFIAYRIQDNSYANNYIEAEKKAIEFYQKFKYQLDAEKIWLVYEKESDTAQDNSFYFFKYCYENHKEKKVFFVIRKDSPDRENLAGMEDRVLEFMSVKHLVYMQAAQLFVASETRGHAYLWRYQKGRMRNIVNGKPFVFLQHGVTAFKLNDSVLRKDSPSAASLYITTSEFERDIIMDGLKYKKEDIIVSGFPRWDVLRDTSLSMKHKEIMIMPTWRSWLDEISDEEFVETDYYQFYMNVLNNDQLGEMLEKNDIRINFMLHPKFKQYINQFKIISENIKLIEFGEVPVNELLMRASLLITDYSSVAWEMFYMSKPVIFAQFDVDKYNELTGSYIDMKSNLFGECVYNVDSLKNEVEAMINNGFQEYPQFSEMRAHLFAFHDQNNSERVYEGILASKFYKKLNKKKYNNSPLPNRIKITALKFLGY